MSSGIYRKQYEALKDLAEGDLGMTVSTSTGSFNEKFCALCHAIIDEFGGTFTALQGGYSERKGSYLWQVAVALGASPTINRILSTTNAARAIHELGNDAVQIGAGSLEWRAYLFLRHSVVGPPTPSELLAMYDGNDGEVLEDSISPPQISPEPDVVEVSCLESSGAQTMSHASITNGAVIVNAGTATGTATAGVITFTAGTISQVQIDGVMTYVCEENSGFPQDVSGSGNHITSMTVTRTTSDVIHSWNLDNGCTMHEYFDLKLTTIPPAELVPDPLDVVD